MKTAPRLPLILLASTATLASPGTGVQGGRNPELDLAKVPQMRPAYDRERFLTGTTPAEFYRRVGIRPAPLDSLPKPFRTWENGFLDTLKDDGKTLSRYGVEAVRESGALWSYWEPMSDLNAIRAEGRAVPQKEAAAWLAKKLYVVAERSLGETCGFRKPSPALRQYNYANFVAHWLMRWGTSRDAAITTAFRPKSVSAFLSDPTLDATDGADLFDTLLNEGARLSPDLVGMTTFVADGSVRKPKVYSEMTKFNVVTIGDAKLVFHALPLYDPNEATKWRRGRNTVYMGPLDEISWGYVVATVYSSDGKEGGKGDTRGLGFNEGPPVRDLNQTFAVHRYTLDHDGALKLYGDALDEYAPVP